MQAVQAVKVLDQQRSLYYITTPVYLPSRLLGCLSWFAAVALSSCDVSSAKHNVTHASKRVSTAASGVQKWEVMSMKT